MHETIAYRFNSFKHDNIGAISTLSRAVRGMKFGRQKVINAFNKFVPKDEYAKNEKDEVLDDLLMKNSSDETPEKTFKNKDPKNQD